MRIRTYIKPNDLNDAYERLIGTKGAVVMGGGMFLRLQKRMLPLAIDLSDLGLSSVKQEPNLVRIGAMTTLRSIETNKDLPTVLQDAVKHIAGVSVRNMATIGGSVMGRYPFSDVITALLALDSTLNFHYKGEVKLVDFLDQGLETEDILTEVMFQQPELSKYDSFRKTYTDFPLVGVGLVKNGDYSMAVGARPGRAKRIISSEIEGLYEALSQMEFGNDCRASGIYRKELAKAVLEDILEGGL